MKIKLMLTLLILLTLISVIHPVSLLTPSGGNHEARGEVIGSDELGTVERLGPYGNHDSPIRIAIITGVHPLEGDAHSAMIQAVEENSDRLRYMYVIYHVNVTRDPSDYERGRMAGQVLAGRYVVPDVSAGDYALAVDVHSNRGNYAVRRFVFTPLPEERSRGIAMELSSRISWLSYHFPESQTSPAYVTEPLIRNGIPAILYENYMYQDPSRTLEDAREFLMTLDSIDVSMFN
ncbi:hypothetical protein DNK57_08225 [Methanothermobacter thermautotrophicus]|uniref:MurNAc-LAA domain-containing protein n=1 Tax=Methanothermobacter thermautotrophicus TaxID=145262 RepID=A0A842YQY0_METTF|nr:hypothetical protein [Methanothermobacter thermautotrophicus]